MCDGTGLGGVGRGLMQLFVEIGEVQVERDETQHSLQKALRDLDDLYLQQDSQSRENANLRKAVTDSYRVQVGGSWVGGWVGGWVG